MYVNKSPKKLCILLEHTILRCLGKFLTSWDPLISCSWALKLSCSPRFLFPNRLPSGNGFRNGSYMEHNIDLLLSCIWFLMVSLVVMVSVMVPIRCLGTCPIWWDLLLSCNWALELSWGPHFLIPNGFLNGNVFRNDSQWVSWRLLMVSKCFLMF